MDKKAFIDKLDAQLKQWDAEVEKMEKAIIKEEKADPRISYNKKIEEFRNKKKKNRRSKKKKKLETNAVLRDRNGNASNLVTMHGQVPPLSRCFVPFKEWQELAADILYVTLDEVAFPSGPSPEAPSPDDDDDDDDDAVVSRKTILRENKEKKTKTGRTTKKEEQENESKDEKKKKKKKKSVQPRTVPRRDHALNDNPFMRRALLHDLTDGMDRDFVFRSPRTLPWVPRDDGIMYAPVTIHGLTHIKVVEVRRECDVAAPESFTHAPQRLRFQNSSDTYVLMGDCFYVVASSSSSSSSLPSSSSSLTLLGSETTIVPIKNGEKNNSLLPQPVVSNVM